MAQEFSSSSKQYEHAYSGRSPKETVKQFLLQVRSGLKPEMASEFLSDTVLAHQITSEQPTTVKRTPANYAEHVKSFLTLFGQFDFEVTELLSDGDKVYARWIQKGRHLAEIDGYEPTGFSLVEYTSAVYRVEDGKIVEYWLQTDRQGFSEQLRQNKQQLHK